MSPRTRSALALGAAAMLAAGLAVLPGTAALADDATPVEPTAENVRSFLDGRVPELLEEHRIPGAAVSVVAGGEQVFAGGYGVTDADAGTPVDPDRVSFPTASVSKSFTAVAVLRLAEDGEVDLHADVNEYLPDEADLPDTYPGQPVTLHHLLTHTAGFEDAVAGMLADTRDEAAPLADYIPGYRPERVYPPGRFVAYSNYGYSLAGLVVEEVSGLSFEEYTAERVFAPLGMGNSGFAFPDDAAERFETATLYYGSPDDPAPDTYLNQMPAGGAYATATDMSRFMLALLGGGELDGERVLSPETVEMMTTRRDGLHPALAGSGYGVWEERPAGPGGPRSVGHGGDYVGAHSHYSILPEDDLGIYVVVNGDGAPAPLFEDARTLIVEEFLAEFAGVGRNPDLPAAADFPLEPYTGVYTTTRTSRSDPSALMIAMDQVMVSAADDGTLHTSSSVLGEQEWTPVEPGVFRSEKGDRLAFSEEDGEITGLGFDVISSQNYERVPWHGQPYLHLAAAGIALLVMATMLVWPVAALVRRLRGRSAPAPAGARAARLAAGAAGLLSAGFIGFMVWLLADQAALEQMLFNESPLLTAPLTALFVLAVALVAIAGASWFRRWWSLAGRIHYSLVVWAVAAFASVGAQYGLVWLPVPLP
ncbi:serine hydrolase domain-containing protein [Actinorugispora endophytica]|uniref:CubicO group peptidase (Beta-lactamase class C family) n=1 Tax=Actinorugispora endophytica TaxID=1605990 RepID=A0A4R6UQW6_9ACTN|nr:serine hydrolase domain-containing protein [Actinorugispora endophytica]TDQ45644.1 CubicO group peptidase (beta-lactamase class C family) [Actinorugispora endophytica]